MDIRHLLLSTYPKECPLPPELSSLCKKIRCLTKEELLQGGVVFAVVGIAVALFQGTVFFAIGFAMLGIVCYEGIQYVKKASLLERLEAAHSRLQEYVKDLHGENTTYRRHNQTLRRSLSLLQSEVTSLQQENLLFQRSNGELQNHVLMLSATNAQLEALAHNVQDQLLRLKQGNTQFSSNLTLLDTEIEKLGKELAISSELRGKIDTLFSSQREGFAEQFAKLSLYLQELKAENKTLEKMRELHHIQEAALRSQKQLSELQLSYAEERGKLETIRRLLEEERKRFAELRELFSSDITTEGKNLKKIVERMSTVLNRVSQAGLSQ